MPKNQHAQRKFFQKNPTNVYQFQKYSPGACQWAQILKFFGLRQNLTHQKKIPKFSHQKWVECEIKKLFKKLFARSILKIKLVPQFRQFLNV